MGAATVVAFCCARGDSDHHVLACAKSPPSVSITAASWSPTRPRWGVVAGPSRREGG